MAIQPPLHGCATPSPTPEQIEKTLKEVATIDVAKNTGTACVAIKPHIFRMDNGTGGLTTEQLAIGLSYLNYHYLAAGIEFYYCGDANYINNSDLYEFDGTAPDNDTEADLAAATTEATDAVNVFFVNSLTTSSGFNACGYAYFPYNTPTANRIVMVNGCTAAFDNGTYPHEFGHYFNLYHTHQWTSSGPTHTWAENVPRTGPDANCTTHGDLLCDTDADHRGNFNSSTCTYTGTDVDENGVPYTPPTDNIMSYYSDACGGLFTPDQYTRIAQGHATRLTHTTYSMDCTPPTVAVPTGLTATFVSNRVDLSWTDVANNELGYVFERSTTSSSTGFVPIQGGVGENGTSFSDNSISPNMTYWYRVKPTNGDCNTYSNTATVTVPFFYCSANSTTCDEFISRVQVGTIDNATSCSPGGYHDYTALSTDVTIGTGTSITVTNGPPTYTGDQCGIWVDWNNDGDFDDTDESMSVTGNGGGGPYTATITPPTGAATGDHVLRIRITYNVTPTACGTHQYGEVEDYTLHIDPCVSQTTRNWTGAVDSDWTNAANWDCGLPGTTNEVVIPYGTPDAVLSLGQTGSCLTLDVETGAVLIVHDGAVLDVVNP
jgi:hypothetical protein